MLKQQFYFKNAACFHSTKQPTYVDTKIFRFFVETLCKGSIIARHASA